MRDGSALERLAETTRAVFDKTGTLTMGTPNLLKVYDLALGDQSVVMSLADHSSHPAARAVAHHFCANPKVLLNGISEIPGMGCEAFVEGRRVRLGRPEWVAEIAVVDVDAEAIADARLAFAFSGEKMAWFTLSEHLREDAKWALQALKNLPIDVEILSGDSETPVKAIAQQLEVVDFAFSQTPQSKMDHILALQKAGEKVLVVGDGINDAPALATAHASIAPASAADVGRQAADFVFTRDSLDAVPLALGIARNASMLVRQNFALALAYNLVAVPLALGGLVTPMLAAIAMSGSSLFVILNALRLLKMDIVSPKSRGKDAGDGALPAAMIAT